MTYRPTVPPFLLTMATSPLPKNVLTGTLPAGWDFPLPENVLIDALPAEWDSPTQRTLLLERLNVGRRLVEQVFLHDDVWVLDERQAPMWYLDLARPAVLEAHRGVQRLGASYENQYVDGELILSLYFMPGSRVIDAIDCDGPGDGQVAEHHVQAERRRAIDDEQQVLRTAMDAPTSVPTSKSAVGTAARRRL